MMSRRSFLRACGAGVLGFASAGCSRGVSGRGSAAPSPLDPSAITGDTPIYDIIDHPLLEGFGRLLFPTTFCPPTEDMTLADMPDILPWYSEIHAATTVDVVRYLLDQRAQGRVVEFDIYTNAEKTADPSLADTGLFHFAA